MGGIGSFFSSYGLLIIVMIAMFAIMIIPQRRRDKKVKAMLAALKPGDRICTIGGLYGTQTVADSISTYDITMLTSIAVYLIPTAFLLRKKKLSEVELYFGRDMK